MCSVTLQEDNKPDEIKREELTMANISENTDGGLITAKLLVIKVMTTCQGGAIG